MSHLLKLQQFVKFTDESMAKMFPEEVFQLLGAPLNNWLTTLLDTLNVLDTPVIHGEVSPQAYVQGRVYISKGVIVEPGAYIQGPAFIGEETEVRHTAYIRGTVYVGKNCVVGHATEVKGSVFFDGAKAGHFAYVGDSLLGREVNLGAGTKLANLKLRGNEVSFIDPETKQLLKSGLRKFGAVIGDFAQTGCNAVLSPGTLLLPNTAVLPCAHYKGTLFKGIANSL